MIKSCWDYRKLRNFRAGIEAGFPASSEPTVWHCTWGGLDHFKTYIWSAVVAHDLALLTRLKPA
jgi:IS5 family transposase